MKAHLLARWLVRLYPEGWRARYGDEFQALLEENVLTPGVMLDVLRGAMDAHLHAQFEVPVSVEAANRFRPATIAVFCAFVVSAIAGMGLYALVDDSPFLPVMRSHPEFALSYDAAAGFGSLAALAVLVGALPVGWAVVRQAIGRWRAGERRDLLLLATPFICAGALALYVGGLAAVAVGWVQLPGVVDLGAVPGPQPLPPGNALIGLITISLFVLAAITSTVALCALVARTGGEGFMLTLRDVRLVVRPYNFARVPSIAAAALMALMLASTLVWGVAASVEVPWAFRDSLLPWALIVVGMSAGVSIAAVALWRGLLRSAQAQ